LSASFCFLARCRRLLFRKHTAFQNELLLKGIHVAEWPWPASCPWILPSSVDIRRPVSQTKSCIYEGEKQGKNGVGSHKKVAYMRKLHITGLHIRVGKSRLLVLKKIGSQGKVAYIRKLHISGLHISGFYCNSTRIRQKKHTSFEFP